MQVYMGKELWAPQFSYKKPDIETENSRNDVYIQVYTLDRRTARSCPLMRDAFSWEIGVFG